MHTFLDKENFNGIEAYLEDGSQKTKDFSCFDYISNEKQHFAKVYGKVFETMDGCDMASRALSIRRQ